MQRRNLNWLIAAVAFAIPVAFALLTNHAWENYFITLRSSRNLLPGEARLKPDWLILRPLEIEQQGITDANMRAHYRVAKVIDHARELRAISFLPGRGWLEFDSQFVVFQRVHDADPEAKISLR